MSLELLTCPLPREYEARLEPDGMRVRVIGVPVFAETREQDGRDDRDEAWLHQALAIYDARAQGGYHPPMHFKHHGASETSPAGHFELTNVAPGEVNPGDVRPVLFADLVFLDKATYERWRSLWPHRSVEISPDYPNEVNSLALLDDEAPYFRFPIPKVRELFSAPSGVVHKIQLWRATMADPVKKDEAPAAGVQAPVPDAQPAAAAPPAPAGGPSPIEMKLDLMLEMLKKLLGMEAEEQEGAYRSVPVVETGGHAAESEKSDKPSGAPAVMSAETAQFNATILGLQEQVSNLQREREVDGMFATAKEAYMAARAKSGRPAPTNEEFATMRKTLQAGGKAALTALLAGLNEVQKAQAPFAPVGYAAATDALDVPASLQPFVAKGGDVAKRAIEITKAFRAGVFKGTGITEARLASCMDLPALQMGVAQPLKKGV